MWRKGKKRTEEEGPADDSDGGPAKKRAARESDDDSIVVCDISKNRRVSVRSWQGKVVVDIREFYTKDGKELPGRKDFKDADARPTAEQVKTCKDRIAATLETLKPTTSWERTTAAGQGLDGVLFGGRGFGVAMEALFTYLSSEYGNTFALGYYDITHA